ncbi:MAG: glycosyltransferase family 2 protein [Bacteroidia bacterium]|nr:glycosyltransferase family 2 protein [Bacteroidia bacterium]
MRNLITCFIPVQHGTDFKPTLKTLRESGVVEKIILVGDTENSIEGTDIAKIALDSFNSTKAIKAFAKNVTTPFILLYTKTLPLDLGQNALHRMVQACNSSGAGMVYSDYFEQKEGALKPHPVIEYQEGSLRDDFDFGSLLLYRTKAFVEAAQSMDQEFELAGLYDLRLKVSQNYRLVHLPELLYTELELDTRKSGEKMFDYVDPRNRFKQIEMEKACTAHLNVVGAWLAPKFKEIAFSAGNFKYEASVIIPVWNRAKTITDAIKSVLSQEVDFEFNLIIVDNYSTDGTYELIKSFADSDDRIIHVIPTRKDLGIGGCWNEAINHPACGKFAIQLDSDDLYIDNTVIQSIVASFYEQNCAMVVGSYKMVNFKLEEISPGLIDHKEWTPENGRNNALRINGLGAPRAFYTPVLREIQVPNVSYGEDYALGLAISRYYQIGRIYVPLYLCRRWDENSDSSLDIVKMNAHNFYKDKIRTLEFWARQQAVKEGN